MSETILVVAAHPDDEVLGCGATIARLSAEGNEVFACILSKETASRQQSQVEKEKIIEKLKKGNEKAAKILGIKKTFLLDFPDNEFDSVSLLSIIKKIEAVVEQVNPSIVFTHHRNDLNIDHRITFEAVLTALRPVGKKSRVKLYCFETLSSTEWNYPSNFSPNYFFDIAKYLDKKIKAMLCYKTEIREKPHPRSIEGIKSLASYRGMSVGINAAEAFELIRVVK